MPVDLVKGTIAYVRSLRFLLRLSESFSSILLQRTAKSMKRYSFLRSPYLSHLRRKLYTYLFEPMIPIFLGFSLETMIVASFRKPAIRTGLGLKAGNF